MNNEKNKKVYIGPSGMGILNFEPFTKVSGVSKINKISSYFNSMELNINSRLVPNRYLFEKYFNESNKNFIFSFNAPKIFNPINILSKGRDNIKLFFQRMEAMRDKVGPIVILVPEGVGYREKGMDDILDILPKHKYVIEICDDSWLDLDCYESLERNNVSLLKDYLSPDDAIGDMDYYRIPFGEELKRVNLGSHIDHAISHVALPDKETYIYITPNDNNLDLALKAVQSSSHRAYNPQSNYKSTSGPDNDPSYYIEPKNDLAFEGVKPNKDKDLFDDDSNKIIDNYPDSEPGTHTKSRV